MKILKNEDLDVIKEILENDGIIAFPTDTVYGLGCIYNSNIAINKIKKAKGRDEKKPLPMMVSDIALIEEVAYINDDAKKIINQFMPGALTIVLKKKETIDDYITNGFDTIAIRIPNHKQTLSILKTINKPMLVTSANKSDTVSKLNSEDVIDDIGCYLDGIILGKSDNNLASTIVDLTNGLNILREGIISKEDIKRVLVK